MKWTDEEWHRATFDLIAEFGKDAMQAVATLHQMLLSRRMCYAREAFLKGLSRKTSKQFVAVRLSKQEIDDLTRLICVESLFVVFADGKLDAFVPLLHRLTMDSEAIWTIHRCLTERLQAAAADAADLLTYTTATSWASNHVVAGGPPPASSFHGALVEDPMRSDDGSCGFIHRVSVQLEGKTIHGLIRWWPPRDGLWRAQLWFAAVASTLVPNDQNLSYFDGVEVKINIIQKGRMVDVLRGPLHLVDKGKNGTLESPLLYVRLDHDARECEFGPAETRRQPRTEATVAIAACYQSDASGTGGVPRSCEAMAGS